MASVCWGAVVSTSAPEPKSTDGSCRSPENASGDLGEFVGCLVVASGDVDELETVELVLEPAYLLAVYLHFRVVAVGGLHHLVDDELGVALNVEASNP